jgi:ribonuclease HIII
MEGCTTPSAWIGTDESGKGDYFGPLVVAGVYVDETLLPKLKALGVKDSKKLSDRAVLELDGSIRSLCPHSVVAIGPEKYNDLYEKIKNLNRLLAWGHARAIENILEKNPCARVVTDQFGDEQLVLNALLKKGREVQLEQRHRAEDDPAVAAASILARAEFLRRLQQLSSKIGIMLPKGASSMVEATAHQIVEKKGIGILKEIAKLHFKTTAKL